MWIHIGSISGKPVWSGTTKEKEAFEKGFREWFATQEKMVGAGFEAAPCWWCPAIKFAVQWEWITWVEIECEGVTEEGW
jgi:hypothetical protein